MNLSHIKSAIPGAFCIGLAFASGEAFAAKPVDLEQQNDFLHKNLSFNQSVTQMAETSRILDSRQTLHVRVQETYKGFQVWGADAVIHIPNGSKVSKSIQDIAGSLKNNNGFMNGVVYEGLEQDLANTDDRIFSANHADEAIQKTIEVYKNQLGRNFDVTNQQSKLIVYIDENNQAHWGFHITFDNANVPEGTKPTRPVFIVNAKSFKVFKQWDEIKTLNNRVLQVVNGGGFGGNLKMGKLVYDGLPKNLAHLVMNYDSSKGACYLQNTDVIVKDYNTKSVMNFPCEATSSDHNNLYWSGDFDKVNGGHSPGNDALFGGQVIDGMYRDWYGTAPLVNADGSPKTLQMVVHVRRYDNAYWDGEKMTFGDGESMFYPLTSLGVAAHEISHGFTEHHSNLSYYGESGGMNEAFSDMAAQAAEVYAYGKNSFQIGPEIFKAQNEALRYLDQPSKDCGSSKPGRNCSIDDATQYYNGLDVHYSSGVYNRFFYLLSTSAGWDVKKAFDVMVKANMNYWTSSSSFKSGACGVLHSAKDLGFDLNAIQSSFKKVAVDTQGC